MEVNQTVMRINSSRNINEKFLKTAGQAAIKTAPAPAWQKMLKRLIDIAISFLGLLLLLPLMTFIAVKIKLDSRGPVFYFQQRIGINGAAFTIFKFRSMYMDAEKSGPSLSSANDHRITRWGRIIRKWKLDELPQLLNILMGDMSLVGPRPERKFYIDKVSVTNRYFDYLHQVKPGLTSLGMIKFGYAENVEQIMQRMHYDLTYIENYSVLLDLQIIYYTFCCIIEGKLLDTAIKPKFRIPRFKISTLN